MSGMPVIVLEQVRTFTPLGIRFWDPVLDEQVRDGLRVTARPAAEIGSRPVVAAFRTRSDIYAFGGLPGLRAVEHGENAGGSPAEERAFIVEVQDAQARFLSAAFEVRLPLPYHGMFLSGAGGSPAERLNGFHLFSAPARQRPSWLGAVRGELVDAATREPAAHAVVRVRTPDGAAHYGLADGAGRLAVLLPYPVIEDQLGGSPGVGGTPLAERRWLLQVEVLYRPALLQALPGTELPDYYSILQQGPGRIWTERPEDGGSAEPHWTGELQYGRELTLRTAGLSQMLVSPADTSP